MLTTWCQVRIILSLQSELFLALCPYSFYTSVCWVCCIGEGTLFNTYLWST